MIRAATLFLLILATGFPAHSNTIRKACLKANRGGTTQTLCSCVQRVANAKLSRKDQKLAATFFKDPHRAQVIRQSDNLSHEAFWQRYKDFGYTAGKTCKDTSNS
jgi:hypothetical protein